MRERYAGTVIKITAPRKFVRGEIWITNAWDEVIFSDPENENSEAKDSQVIGAGNLDRLRRELSDIEYAIICCGAKASLAVGRLQDQNGLPSHVGVFYILHLGNKPLNLNIALGSGAKIASNERRIQRIEVVAKCLRDQVETWFKEESHRQSQAIAASPQEREDQDFVDTISYWGDE